MGTKIVSKTEDKATSGICLKSFRSSLTCFLACAALSLVAACGDDGKSDVKDDACAGVSCNEHGTCAVKDGAAVCSCEDGYHVKEGDATSCEADEPGEVIKPVTCDGVDCSGHGTCEVKDGAAACVCDAGYHTKSGDVTSCEADEPGEVTPGTCDGVDCSGHGTCEVKDGAAACVCDDGYHVKEGDATSCEADEPGEVTPGTCEGVDCDGHGTCEVKDDAAVCSCEDGYKVKADDAKHCEAVDPGNPGENTCTDVCEANILRCSGVNRERCQLDENQCLQWQTENCPENTHCDENSLQCVANDSGVDPKTCTNPCESGSKRCLENAIQACQTDENGCNIWKTEKQCGTQKCDESSYTCVSVCTDVCTKGNKQCSEQNVQECKVNSSSGCTEWVTADNCTAKNQACNASTLACDIPYVSPNSVDGFQIMYNWGIFASDLTEDDVKNIKNAGFTLVPLSNQAEPYDKYNDAMKKAIQLLDKEGINVIVNDYTFQIIRWLDSWSESSPNPTKDLIASQIKFYSQFKNVVGFDVRDEPCLKDLDNTYKNLIKFITANSKDREVYINLFPDYVNASGCCLQSEYSTYLNNYAGAFKNTSVKVLSVDYYPDNLKTSSQNTLNEKRSFYDALNTIRTTAQKNNLIPMNISLSTEHGNFKTSFEMREIAWQIAADIAHGMKRISYFTYSTMNEPSFKPSNMEMIDPNTKKPTQRYEEVKAINSILGPIGKEIYSKKVKYVTNVDSSCNSSLLTKVGDDLCVYNDDLVVNAVVDINNSNAIVTTFDDDNTFLLTATSIENFKDSVFTFRWPFPDLQWYDYNSGKYKTITNGVLDGRELYSAEIKTTSEGKQITFHVKAGYALLLRNHN